MEYILGLNQKIKELINETLESKIKKVILYVTSFFIGSINFYGTFSVFSIALYIVAIKNKSLSFLYTLLMLCSCFISGEITVFIKFLFVILFVFLLTYGVSKNSSIRLDRLNIYKLSLMISTLYFMLSLGMASLTSFTTFVIASEFMASMLIFTTSVMINRTYKLLSGTKMPTMLEKDTITSIILYIILFLTSLNGIFINGVYIQEVAIFFLLESSTYVLGELYGALIGTILTIPLMLGGGYEVNLSILSFIGIIMGVLKNINKYLFALIYTITTFILYLTYADSINLSITFIINILVCQILFLIIPSKIYENVKQKIDEFSKIKKKTYYEKIKNKISTEMLEKSESIKNFSNVYSRTLEIDDKKEENKKVIDNVIKTICGNCTERNNCWKENFYTTYTFMMEMFKRLEENNSKNDMIEKCKRHNCKNGICLVNQFSIETRKLKNLNDEKKYANGMKKMFLNYLIETSSMLSEMSQDIIDFKAFRTHTEEIIYDKLYEEDIDALKVEVMQDKNDRYEIEVIIPKELKEVQDKILYLVSFILKKKFHKISKKINEDEISIKIYEKENITLDYGIFQMPKFENNVNGDNYSILRYNNNNVLIAVADGMGKGKEANEKSRLALQILESLVKLNFSEKVMIEMINTLLVNNKDIFTTLDTCIVDLYNSSCKFIKSGSVSTYIKRKNKVEVIETKSLPIGIVDEVIANVEKVELKKGDVIFLISDGVIDNINSKFEKEKYLISMIKQIDADCAQEYSFVLGSIIAKNNVLKDDMTIITTIVK